MAAGSLTQEQADLILKYYAEQLTNQQNGTSYGKGSRVKNWNNSFTNDQNNENSLNGFGGKGGRGDHGRFSQQQNRTQQDTAPQAPVSPDVSGT